MGVGEPLSVFSGDLEMVLSFSSISGFAAISWSNLRKCLRAERMLVRKLFGVLFLSFFFLEGENKQGDSSLKYIEAAPSGDCGKIEREAGVSFALTAQVVADACWGYGIEKMEFITVLGGDNYHDFLLSSYNNNPYLWFGHNC